MRKKSIAAETGSTGRIHANIPGDVHMKPITQGLQCRQVLNQCFWNSKQQVQDFALPKIHQHCSNAYTLGGLKRKSDLNKYYKLFSQTRQTP